MADSYSPFCWCVIPELTKFEAALLLFCAVAGLEDYSRRVSEQNSAYGSDEILQRDITHIREPAVLRIFPIVADREKMAAGHGINRGVVGNAATPAFKGIVGHSVGQRLPQ